jgi:hypothetical protein
MKRDFKQRYELMMLLVTRLKQRFPLFGGSTPFSEISLQDIPFP